MIRRTGLLARGMLYTGVFLTLLAPQRRACGQVMLWDQLTTTGGTGNDAALGVATDDEGNRYVTGHFAGKIVLGTIRSGVIITIVSLTSDGSDDMFLVKYNNTGTPQWAVKGGGPGEDWGKAVAVDPAGFVYVTGYFSGTATFGTMNVSSAGGKDIFVAKYTTDGVFQSLARAGGIGDDMGNGVSVDTSTGYVWVVGTYNATATFPSIPLPRTLTSQGGTDVFVARCAGTLWNAAASFGGSGNDEGNGIVYSTDGTTFVGSFSGTATFGSTNLTTSGGTDIFIATLLPGTTNVAWAERAGGSGADVANGVCLEEVHSILPGLSGLYADVIGAFSGTATFKQSNTVTSAGGQDVFVASYRISDANFLGVTRYGGSGNDVGYSIACVNKQYGFPALYPFYGWLAITGSFQNTAVFNGDTLQSAGADDIFVYRSYYAARSNGIVGMSGHYAVAAGGPSAQEAGCGVALNDNEQPIVAGVFSGTATFGGTPRTSAGGTDLFILNLTGALYAPDKLTLASPDSGATSGGNQVRVTWRPAAASSQVSKYWCERASDSYFTSPVRDTSLTDTADVFTGLAPGVFWWRAKAKNLAGWGAFSNPWNFTFVTLPESPALLYPGDMSNVVNMTDSVTHRWRKCGQCTDRYRIEVGTDAAFQFASVDSMVTDTSHTTHGLVPNQKYYWRVRPHNAAGWGDYSLAWSFIKVIGGVEAIAGMPREFALHQNYPNPFNPTATIRYELPHRSSVVLTMYNTLGQLVATFVDAPEEAGYHEVKIDASNLASGVYLYRLHADTFVATKKLVVVK